VGGLNTQGTTNIERSTVAGNTTSLTAPGSQIEAPGIFAQTMPFTLRSSTIALNGPSSGTLQGGNFSAVNSALDFSSTIFSDPRGGGLNCAITGGSVTSDGFNDDFSPGGGSCPPDGTSDVFVNPLLSPAGLANNGGLTQTIALQPTSPMIDAGSNAGDVNTTEDQRGLRRPVDFTGVANAAGGNGADIGAFEFQSTCTGQAVPAGTCPGPGGSGGGGTTNPPPPAPPASTGLRAKALKKCKKIKGKKNAKKRSKCLKRAKKLPV
jgi:hypothetical protein